jgi:opacity protein-like surface antigen
MMRFRLVMLLGAATAFGVSTVYAQTPGTATLTDSGYAELTGGPTFGHTASGSVGGEAGYWVTARIGLFGEGGLMFNVATSTTDVKAKAIADFLSATFKAKQSAAYVDGGAIVRFSPKGRSTPYALLGVGTATATSKTTFAVNGKDITGELPQRGVQPGTDLSGSYTKFFVTVGAGAHIKLTGRWIADMSYRYGHIGKHAASGIPGINSSRLQFGIGTKF